MFKNLKMKTLLSLGVGFVSLVCLIISGFVIGSRVNDITRDAAITNMNTSLDGQAALIALFVSDSECMLKSYASADEIMNLLKDPDNPEYIVAAQTYTEKFFSNLEDWEGIYLSDWNTKVLAHSSAGAVGMVTRTEDQLPAYRATMTTAPDGFFNGGAFVSPASGQLIFNLRMAVYNENGEPIGFVGGGPFISGLNKLLAGTEVGSLSDGQYAVVDTSNLIYAYHTDTGLITTPVEDEVFLEIAKNVAYSDEGGTDHRDGKMTVYKNMHKLNLLVLMQDDEKALLADSYAVIKIFVVFVAITELLVLFVTFMVSMFATAPLKKVTSAVNNLGDLSLKPVADIEKYSGRKSEVGIIAKSVGSLNEVLRKIVSMLNECSLSLNKGSTVMKSTVSSLSNCANNNTVTVQELSAGVNYANESIRKVNDDIDTVSNIMTETRKVNSERFVSATEMIAKTDRLFSDVTKKTTVTETHIEESLGYLNNFARINENVKIIQDIASQTQLLAVNASIESSKAGAAGKGFAVLSSEIKSLAVNSSNAANAIDDVCAEMNSNIKNIKSCFDDIMSFMKNDIVDVFNNMQEVSGILRDTIEHINADMNSISRFIKNISSEAGELRGVILKNGDGAEKISERIQVTYSMVQKLEGLVSKNTEAVKNINSIISQFK